MRLSIIPYKTVIPTKHQPEYQAYDSTSIVDVQDWLIALFGVLEVTSLAKVGNFQNFCFYIKQMIIYEQNSCEHNLFWVWKKIPCFFCFSSQFPPLKRKSVFFTWSVAKSSTTVWLGGPSPSRFVAIAAERTVAEDKERLTPCGWPMGKRLFNMMRFVVFIKESCCDKGLKFLSRITIFLNFQLFQWTFCRKNIHSFLFLLTTKLVVLNGRKDWCHPSCPGDLWQVGWGSPRESGMSSETHKNSVLLEDFNRLKGDERLTVFSFSFRDGISCFWRSVNSTIKNIFLMFAFWLFGKIIVVDFLSFSSN